MPTDGNDTFALHFLQKPQSHLNIDKLSQNTTSFAHVSCPRKICFVFCVNTA